MATPTNTHLNLLETPLAEFFCYYCGREVSLSELTKVDDEIDRMSEGYGEGVVENLPASRRDKIEPYVHQMKVFDNWFKVVNTCEKCLAKARAEFVRVASDKVARVRNVPLPPIGFYNK